MPNVSSDKVHGKQFPSPVTYLGIILSGPSGGYKCNEILSNLSDALITVWKLVTKSGNGVNFKYSTPSLNELCIINSSCVLVQKSSVHTFPIGTFIGIFSLFSSSSETSILSNDFHFQIFFLTSVKGGTVFLSFGHLEVYLQTVFASQSSSDTFHLFQLVPSPSYVNSQHVFLFHFLFQCNLFSSY